MTAEASDQLVGTLSDGRYRIEALLGEGAVGAVYRAVDTVTGAPVALKQWHAFVLNDEVRERFLREATALETLAHPNIVRVVGIGVGDGVPYVALEYLEGETLEALVSGGKPLEPGLAFDVAQQALSAIAFAHSHDVVHRDLKPENIFIARDAHGRPAVKILDYGLAKFMSQPLTAGHASAPLTATGVMIGTPLYMPPEQAAGSSVDVAADVYSMGCVLFEMLSGRPPFLADSKVDLINAHFRAPVPLLSEALPDMQVAPELQALIERAMAKKQIERFPNAGAMLAALRELPAAPITPRPPRAVGAHAVAKPRVQAARAASATATPERSSSAGAWIAVVLIAVGAFWLARTC